MKKLTNKKTLITALCAILVVVAMVFTFTACNGNKDKEPTSTTAPTSETETVFVPVIEDVTDEAGEPVTDAEGEKVTEVVGTTAVVVDEDEEAPSFVQKRKPTKPNKPTTTEDEKEETATKAPETTKPKPQPTQPKPTEPKPTQPKPSEPKPTQPSGGGTGGIIWDDFDKGPDTDHVGGESSEEIKDAVQEDIDKNGWDLDWELN